MKKKRGVLLRTWRVFKKIVLYGFLFSIFYILLCKWVNPPITITQLGSYEERLQVAKEAVDGLINSN